MKRKVKKPSWDFSLQKKADAILTADIQLLENNPPARLDNFVEETQWVKLDFLSELQKHHDCPILHSGDLLDFWKASPWLLSKIIEHIPNEFWTIYGNHDLPQHSMELEDRSGVYTLLKAGKIKLLYNHLHWGETHEEDLEPFIIKGRKILLWHVMTYQGKIPYPGCKDKKAAGLLRRYKRYDLIVTGHNHKPFVEEYEGRLLVNPGSIYRVNADQETHKPRIYLWYAKDNSVIPVYLPIEENVISREHIELKQERDNRINAFIESFSEQWETKKGFEENLEAFFAVNNTKSPVKEIIQKALENEKA